TIVRDVSHELGCVHVRMDIGGRIFDEQLLARDRHRCSTIRIPLEDEGYVNFRYPMESSVRYAVALSSIAQILQRSIVPGQAAVRAVHFSHRGRYAIVVDAGFATQTP